MRQVPRSALWLAALLVGLLALPWEPIQVRLHAAAPTFGAAFANSGGGDFTIAMTGVTNGATVIVGVGATDTSNRTLTDVTDDVNAGDYTVAIGPIRTTGANQLRSCWIAYKQNVSTTAGALTLTIDMSAAGAFVGTAIWITGAATGAPTTDSVADAADATAHTAAASLTAAADSFTYSYAAANSSLGTITETATPDFIDLEGTTSMSAATMAQYYNGGLAISANTLAWTSGSARSAASCTASFAAAASGGPPSGSLSLLGVGK
jgi:hypothetical protein